MNVKCKRDVTSQAEEKPNEFLETLFRLCANKKILILQC